MVKTEHTLEAHYFDGINARLHQVLLDIGQDVIALAGGDVVKSYHRSQARMAEPFSGAPCVLDFSDGARCEVHGAEQKAALAAALGYAPSRVVRMQQQWLAALLAMLLLAASIAGAAIWGVPLLAEKVVAGLPLSVDIRAGDEALRAMEKRMLKPSRLSDQRHEELRAILARVLPEKTRVPIQLRFYQLHSSPNAFALPNGTIVMSDEMVLHVLAGQRDLDQDMQDAIAGVLAHEIGHIEERHSMRVFARSSLLALGSAALFGDFSTAAAGAPALLMNTRYSRDMERAADDYAIKRMTGAGLPTIALGELFESLDNGAEHMRGMPEWMKQNIGYLSSHPNSEERIARFYAESLPRSPSSACGPERACEEGDEDCASAAATEDEQDGAAQEQEADGGGARPEPNAGAGGAPQ